MPKRKSPRDPDFARTVGSRLKALRSRAGMSQAAVAEALGVEPSSVTRMESGARPVPLTLLPVLVGIYGATIADVFSDASTTRPVGSEAGDDDALRARWCLIRPSARQAVLALLDELVAAARGHEES